MDGGKGSTEWGSTFRDALGCCGGVRTTSSTALLFPRYENSRSISSVYASTGRLFVRVGESPRRSEHAAKDRVVFTEKRHVRRRGDAGIHSARPNLTTVREVPELVLVFAAPFPQQQRVVPKRLDQDNRKSGQFLNRAIPARRDSHGKLPGLACAPDDKALAAGARGCFFVSAGTVKRFVWLRSMSL